MNVYHFAMVQFKKYLLITYVTYNITSLDVAPLIKIVSKRYYLIGRAFHVITLPAT